MRWDRLFDDLEAQLASDEAIDRAAEIADRTRRERSLVDVHARLLANVGQSWPGGSADSRCWHELWTSGPTGSLAAATPSRPLLLRLDAVRSVSGLRRGAHTPSIVARRVTLALALGAVSRDRAPVEVRDVEGRVLVGTIDVVGSDHLEVAEHAGDEPRRTANVTAVTLVPFSALAWVRRVRPISGEA